MQVRWSPEAYEDLAAIGQYIRDDDHPSAALRVVTDIYNRAASLQKFPSRGRLGRVEGTREMPLPPLPFIIVYRVFDEAVEIAAIIHGAQKWPRA